MTTPPPPWRDSARPVRIWAFDARLVLPAALLVLWPSLATAALLLLTLAAFRIAEARGYRLAAALRAVRRAAAGSPEALSPMRRRRFTDFG